MKEHRWAFKVFSTHGHIGRLRFAYVFMLGIIGFGVCSTGMLLCRLTFLNIAAYLAICVTLFIVYTIAAIKRFHDLNRPGTDYFLTLIPVYNLYIFIKLLFFRSKPSEEFEPKQNNAHFWHIPIIMLLLPALFFGVGVGYGLNKEIPSIPFDMSHIYSKESGYSLDLAHGAFVDVHINPTSEKPFSEYSEKDFARLSEYYGTEEAYVKYILNIDTDIITNAAYKYTYKLEEINGKKFVHITSTRQSTIHQIIGIYGSTKYEFDFWLWADDDLATRYFTQMAIQSIRIGEDANPQKAG